MKQCRVWMKLDDAEGNVAFAVAIAAQPRAGKRQQRAQPLAAGGNNVAGELRYQRDRAVHALDDDLVDRSRSDLSSRNNGSSDGLTGTCSRSAIVSAAPASPAWRAATQPAPSLTRARASQHRIAGKVKGRTAASPLDSCRILSGKAHNPEHSPAKIRPPDYRSAHAKLPMKELLRTNDAVRLSWAQAVLARFRDR